MENYKVLILGNRGAGKTVFLSSMFYQLSAPHELCFYVEPNDSQQKRMLYHAYNSLHTEWLPPTLMDEIQEWQFKVIVQNNKGNFPAFEITYYDYAGGRLTDPNFNDNGEFDKLVAQSDVLLGFIDGHKLMKYMQNPSQNRNFETLNLNIITDALSKNSHANKSIQLIITKWDILADRFSFIDIRQKLLSIDKFSKFSSLMKDKGCYIRLIPVSSVGFDFATLDNDGDMKLKENRQLKPFQVEVPLALSLNDKIMMSIEEKVKKTKAEIEANKGLPPKNGKSWWEIFSSLLGIAGDILGFLNLNKIEAIVNRIENAASKKSEEIQEDARKRKEEVEANLKQEISKVNDEASALRFVISNSFESIEAKLDMEFPNSRIN